MFWYQRFLLLPLIQMLVHLLKQGNGQNQHVPFDKTFPFLFKNYGTMVEFPSIPALHGVSLVVHSINHESGIMYLGDPQGCLPRLFLQLGLYNSTNILPLEFYHMNEEYNVTFFDCSSLGTRYLRNGYFSQDNMSICPIYAVSSNDSILYWDVTFCTKMSQLVSPIPAWYIQGPYLPFLLPRQSNSDVETHTTTSGKIPEIVLPGACNKY